MKPQPDPDLLADAERRAARIAEVVPGRSNLDANRILAFDVLGDFVFDIYEGRPEQIAWALLWAERATGLERHEVKLREDAWKKVNDDADRARWERLGLERGNA